MNLKIHNNYIFITSVISLCFVLNVLAKDKLYMPLNIRDAYVKETRSYDGKPGKKYWQNSSNYKMKVEVIPDERLIKGTAKITYYNNSPDTLKSVVFRLYQNIHKSNAVRNFFIRPDLITEGMKITRFVYRETELLIDDQKQFKRTSTNLILSLNADQKIPPNSSEVIEIDWNFTMPEVPAIRMGVYKPQTFFIAYWYPQISVYDDIDGWDLFDYNGEQEFYNDFSNFEVDVLVPNNIGVWATGVLQNPEEVLQKKFYKRYLYALASDEVINIITKEDIIEGGVYIHSEKNNVWKFTAQNVPDFTFAISDSYLWDAVSLQVGQENKRVYIAAVYDENSSDFYDVASISRKVLQYYSNELPGVAYPYPSLTIFNGSGGMEFPMIINNGSEKSHEAAVSLAAHEIAHMYFPFYLGTNERKYAFMDEGWAVLMQMNFLLQNFPGTEQIKRRMGDFERHSGQEDEMPMVVPSTLLRGSSYRTSAYARPGIAYHLLMEAAGSDTFNKALKEYISRWNGKHPIPYDFYYTFNDAAKNNLNWFWKPWFFEFGYPDLAIKTVDKNEKGCTITIEKIGVLPVPIQLTIITNDGSEINIYREISIWKNGSKEIEIKTEIKNVKEIILGGDNIPDVNKTNNHFISEHQSR